MLRLLSNDASPFARKVRLAALERGVELKIDTVYVDPAARNADLAAVAPLAKIPVLMTPQGAIYDSRLICRYIDRLGVGPSLYVSEFADVWQIQRLEALADGVMDAAVNCRYELVMRPAHLRWDAWILAQFARVDAALDELDEQTGLLAGLHLGSLAVASALTYLDFRHSDRPWRQGRSRLADWLTALEMSPEMQSTIYR